MPEELLISPYVRRNGMTLTALGVTGVLLGLLLFISFSALFAVGLMLFCLGTIGLVLGVAKLNEPECSIKFTATGMHYYHRRGQHFIEWGNIQRIDAVRVTQNMEVIELPYIGFKLKKINPILDVISPRLATGLLTEQRPLLMTAATQDDDLHGYETYLNAEFTPLVVNGDRYRGVLAMFGHRCEMLAAHLGYHLYISVDSLDREPKEFVSLLRQWQQQFLILEAQTQASNSKNIAENKLNSDTIILGE